MNTTVTRRYEPKVPYFYCTSGVCTAGTTGPDAEEKARKHVEVSGHEARVNFGGEAILRPAELAELAEVAR
jgi:hypothetical protein